MCEEFGCRPSQLDEEDPGLLMRIAQLRGYAATFEAIKHAESQKDAPTGPMTDIWADVQRARQEQEAAAWAEQREES